MAIPSDRQAQQQQPPQQSAQHEIVEWYKSVPPVTRFLLTSVVAVSALGNFRLIPPGFFALIYQPAIKELQIWRLMTCFFYGQFGFPFLWTVYFLYNHSRGLESGHFAGRTGDYAWCLFLIMSTLVLLGFMFGGFFLMSSLIYGVVYLWSQTNRESIVNFMFGIRVKAMYFPFVLLGFDLLMGSFDILNVAGMFAAHGYYFLTEIYPTMSGGTRLIQTPAFINQLLPPNDPAFGEFNSSGVQSGARPTKESEGRGYTWGKGRKLGS